MESREEKDFLLRGNSSPLQHFEPARVKPN